MLLVQTEINNKNVFPSLNCDTMKSVLPLQFILLTQIVHSVHIEHDHIDHYADKYYQYGYQVDDHYTGNQLIIVLLNHNIICY